MFDRNALLYLKAELYTLSFIKNEKINLLISNKTKENKRSDNFLSA